MLFPIGMKNTIKRTQPKPAPSTVTQCSGCSFRVNVNQGMLTAYSPVRVSMIEPHFFQVLTLELTLHLNKLKNL